MRGWSVSRKVAPALAVLAAMAWGAAAFAQVTGEAAKLQVEEAYGVEVLSVSPGEIDDRAVWLLTVMVPEGDSNAAFMVTRLAVDQETGDLVPSFRHRASGYDLPGGLRDDKSGLRPDTARGGPWR